MRASSSLLLKLAWKGKESSVFVSKPALKKEGFGVWNVTNFGGFRVWGLRLPLRA